MSDLHDEVKERLRPLFSDERNLAKASSVIVRRLAFLGGRPPPKSSLLDFAAKVDVVLSRIDRIGFTREQYLSAISKEPQLLLRNPEAIVSWIETMENYAVSHDLAPGSYLKAVLVQQPSLLLRNPRSLIRHIEFVTERFAGDGLTASAYLRALATECSVLKQSPERIIQNVEAVTRHFAPDGLTCADYLRAVLRKPSLLHLRPQTVIDNIDTLVDQFSRAGMTRTLYLKAALSQPALFYQTPATVASRIFILSHLCAKGLLGVHESVSTKNDDGTAAAVRTALRNPVLLTLSNENLMLREIYVATLRASPGVSIVTRPRRQIEQELIQTLDQGRSDSVSKIDREQGHGPHARNLLLRALIREGWVKGKLY